MTRRALLAMGALAARAQTTESLDADWELVSTVSIETDLHHVQGIDIEDQTLWVSSVHAKARKGYLSRLERATGRLLAQVEIQEGDRIHPGGIALDGDGIWVPVAEYDRDGPATIERRDKLTLARQTAFEVPDHIGCIAASDTELAGGSWGSRTIYRWRKDGTQIARLANPSSTQWQDLKFDGPLLVGSGGVTRETGAIEWVRLPSLDLERRITTGATDRGVPFTNEGMTLRAGRLFLLPEDYPTRLFEFARRR